MIRHLAPVPAGPVVPAEPMVRSRPRAARPEDAIRRGDQVTITGAVVADAYWSGGELQLVVDLPGGQRTVVPGTHTRQETP